MIKAADYSGLVPYGQECDPELASLLPVGIYLLVNYPPSTVSALGLSAAERVARLVETSDPLSGAPVLESRGSQFYFLAPALSIVPLRDQDALALLPVGQKVKLFSTDPAQGCTVRLDGIVIEHLKRRVRVMFAFTDGTPGQRDLYISQLGC